MSAAAATAIRRGSCLCRSVKYSLTGTPARNIMCNCINCQKASGSAFLTNQLWKRNQYKVESGNEFIKIYKDANTDSGGVLERAFCSQCGSNLSIANMTNPKMKENIVIPAGTIDDNYKDFVPQSELFAHRRHQWVPGVVKKASSKGKQESKM